MNWNDFLKREDVKKDLKIIKKEIKKQEKEGIVVLPLKNDRFKCFDKTKLCDVKVVIIGMDPYKNIIDGIPQAQGFSFSVPDNFPFPPTLINIFKELVDDIKCETPISGNLTKWTEQGVLLLNRTLTLKQGISNSHKDLWTDFSQKLIKFICENKDDVIFICWGNDAKDLLRTKGLNLKETQIIISGTHPSPLGANKGGFFDGKYFSRVNAILKKRNMTEIDWNLND